MGHPRAVERCRPGHWRWLVVAVAAVALIPVPRGGGGVGSGTSAAAWAQATCPVSAPGAGSLLGQMWRPCGVVNRLVAFDRHRNIAVAVHPDGSTWELNGQSWARCATGGSAPASSTLHYSEHRRSVIRVDAGPGGWDTSEWTRDGWRSIAARAGEPGASWFDVTSDTLRQRVVLVSTQRAGKDPTMSTWELDGARWSKRQHATAVSTRHSFRVMYDEGRRLVVLAGGEDGCDCPLAPTWEWDGSDWVSRGERSRLGRRAHTLAYDGLRKRVVSFGGSDGGCTWGKTYVSVHEWTGGTWEERPLAGSPPVRRSPGVYFDARRGALVAFGGRESTGDDSTEDDRFFPPASLPWTDVWYLSSGR